MNLSLPNILSDAFFFLSFMSSSIHMRNMSKIIKIVYMLSLICFPFYYDFCGTFLNYGMGILHWIFAVKCAKSFNFNGKNRFNNIILSLKDLRMKDYDSQKKIELEHNIHHLSTYATIFTLLAKYGTYFICLLTLGDSYSDLLNNQFINEQFGPYFIFLRFVYALYYGILISTAIQNLALLIALLLFTVAKFSLSLSYMTEDKQLSQFLKEVGYELGDQRPYSVFNSPAFVKSVSSFWSESWHTMLRDIFILVPRSFYKKSSKSVKSMLALSAFITSGIFHDYLIVVCEKRLSPLGYSSTIYFLIQGIAVLVEYTFFAFFSRKLIITKVLSCLFGYGILIFSCPYFVEPVKNLGIFDELHEVYCKLPKTLIY